jgi:hypothetical protein
VSLVVAKMYKNLIQFFIYVKLSEVVFKNWFVFAFVKYCE